MILDRIQGYSQHAGKGLASILVADIRPIQRDIGLIGFSTVDRAAAEIEILRAERAERERVERRSPYRRGGAGSFD